MKCPNKPHILCWTKFNMSREHITASYSIWKESVMCLSKDYILRKDSITSELYKALYGEV